MFVGHLRCFDWQQNEVNLQTKHRMVLLQGWVEFVLESCGLIVLRRAGDIGGWSAYHSDRPLQCSQAEGPLPVLIGVQRGTLQTFVGRLSPISVLTRPTLHLHKYTKVEHKS